MKAQVDNENTLHSLNCIQSDFNKSTVESTERIADLTTKIELV